MKAEGGSGRQARFKRDRGASILEYALLIGLASLVAIPAVSVLGKSASRNFSVAATPSVTGDDTLKGRGAPTSAEAPVASTISASWVSADGVRDGTKWTAQASLVVVNNLGQPVDGASVALFVFRYQQGDKGVWSWQRASQGVSTGSDGSAQLRSGPYQLEAGQSQVTQVEFVVQSVSAPSAPHWDESAMVMTIDKP